MEYKLEKSPRKTFVLKVEDDGSVLVKAPLTATKKQIQEFVQKHIGWIEKSKQRVERRNKLTDLTAKEKAELKRIAGEYLPKRVEHYAKIMGLAVPSVKITSAKKRFGSCSYTNGLCFSLFLMKYPIQAIDYVVVHELAHIRYKNHSAAFYALIKKYLPDYKLREKMLKGD